MPVKADGSGSDVSQREQYAKGGVGRAYWDLRDRAILDRIGGGRILDAGCGEGITGGKIASCFPDAKLTMIDADPRNIAICQKYGLPATQASVYALPFANDSFDVCLLIEVIEHLENPDAAVGELARVTRPGGKVIIVFPVDWTMWLARVVCLRWKEAGFDPGHLRQWNFRELAALCGRAGLRLVEKKGLPLRFPMLHGLVVAEKI